MDRCSELNLSMMQRAFNKRPLGTQDDLENATCKRTRLSSRNAENVGESTADVTAPQQVETSRGGSRKRLNVKVVSTGVLIARPGMVSREGNDQSSEVEQFSSTTPPRSTPLAPRDHSTSPTPTAVSSASLVGNLLPVSASTISPPPAPQSEISNVAVSLENDVNSSENQHSYLSTTSAPVISPPTPSGFKTSDFDEQEENAPIFVGKVINSTVDPTLIAPEVYPLPTTILPRPKTAPIPMTTAETASPTSDSSIISTQSAEEEVKANDAIFNTTDSLPVSASSTPSPSQNYVSVKTVSNAKLLLAGLQAKLDLISNRQLLQSQDFDFEKVVHDMKMEISCISSTLDSLPLATDKLDVLENFVEQSTQTNENHLEEVQDASTTICEVTSNDAVNECDDDEIQILPNDGDVKVKVKDDDIAIVLDDDDTEIVLDDDDITPLPTPPSNNAAACGPDDNIKDFDIYQFTPEDHYLHMSRPVTIRSTHLAQLRPNKMISSDVISFLMSEILDQQQDYVKVYDDIHIMDLEVMETLRRSYAKISAWNNEADGRHPERLDKIIAPLCEANIFENKVLFFPINPHVHFALMVVVNPGGLIGNGSQCQVWFMDSLREKGIVRDAPKYTTMIMKCLRRVAEMERPRMPFYAVPGNAVILADSPVQGSNDNNCGIHLLHCYEKILKSRDMICQQDLRNFRWEDHFPLAQSGLKDEPRKKIIQTIMNDVTPNIRSLVAAEIQRLKWTDLAFCCKLQ